MSVAILGSGTFQDSFVPVKGKSEWGMDTLTRKLTGARSLLEAFIGTLSQGQAYQGYYLQTWNADDSPDVASITLDYKGLLTGGTPSPKAISSVVSGVGQTTADFSTEGIVAGTPQGRKYRSDLIWTLTSIPTTGQIVGTTAAGFRDRYALSATLEFAYKIAQTTYRYITQGKPNAPRYTAVDINYPAFIQRGRIILNDGTILPRGVPWETFFDLTPVQINQTVSFQSEPVIGTPFWENEDVVQRILGNA